jgi:protein kinase-like protein/WD40 repeat protein
VRDGRGGVTGRPLDVVDPRRVGPYALVARLGRGGMGTVYLGEAPDGRPVAVKVLRPELAEDEEFLARFRDEVASAARVASFCTAQVLDDGMADGRVFMVTEYIEGPSLKDRVAADGPLPPGMLHGVAVGVAAALVAIHAAGLIHRDLKPGNVLLSMSGPRVIDFGIARALDATSGHTRPGEVMGSPGWIAPEQILNGEVTGAVDVFAWGCLLGYAGNGHHPFGQGTFEVMAARAVHAEPDIGSLPAPLAGLVQAALDKNPRRRPTARELLLALAGGADDADDAGGEAAVSAALSKAWRPPASTEAPASPADAAMCDTPPLVEDRTNADAAPPLVGEAVTAGAARRVGAVDARASSTPYRPQDGGRQDEPNYVPPQHAGPRVAAQASRRPRARRRRVLVAGGTALAVAAVSIGLLALRPGDDEPPPRRPPDGPPVRPAPLPSDRLVVRLDTAAGWPNPCHADIAVTGPGADHATTLSAGSGCDTHPQWSPNHRRIAFTRKKFGPSEVWVMNADGSGKRLISDQAMGETRVTWAPDSRQVVYQAEDGDFYAVTVGASTSRRLTTSRARKSDPVWSPDGRHLAFWLGTVGYEQIYVLDLRKPAGPLARLTSTPHGAVDPVWSPDGRRMAFTYGTGDGSSDIWVMNADGTGQRPLGTPTKDREIDPSWSPDGTWIAYTKGPWGDPRTWATRADGSGAQALTAGSRREGHPAWS